MVPVEYPRQLRNIYKKCNNNSRKRHNNNKLILIKIHLQQLKMKLKNPNLIQVNNNLQQKLLNSNLMQTNHQLEPLLLNYQLPPLEQHPLALFHNPHPLPMAWPE